MSSNDATKATAAAGPGFSEGLGLGGYCDTSNEDRVTFDEWMRKERRATLDAGPLLLREAYEAGQAAERQRWRLALVAERVAAAGCPPPGWLAPGVVPSPVGRTYTQSELDAAVAAERERCANLRTVAGQVLRDMQAQGVLLEWQTLLDEALMA